jgi:hypothetical protein
MVAPNVKDQILNDLEQLSPEMQARAAQLVHALVSPFHKGASGRDLVRLSGIIDPESAREMIEAIDEGCDRARRGDRDRILAVLTKVPDAPPEPGDEM